MIKALIFDFDGLILDTETAWFEAYQKTLKEVYQYDLTVDEFVKCVGTSTEVLYQHLQKVLDQPFDGQKLRAQAGQWHAEQVRQLPPRSGVAAYLADAQKMGLQVALATSSTRDWITEHLSRLQLISYFDHFITQEDVENVKPAPDLFLKAVDVLGVQSTEALVFEDSLNGLIAANKAGLKTVIVPNSLTEHLPFVDYHLRLSSMADMSLQEVLQTV
jgi:putative hydrolase of the HAD superfamily